MNLLPTCIDKLLEFSKESLQYLKNSQKEWHNILANLLNSTCSQIGISLARPRSEEQKKLYLNEWNTLTTIEKDFCSYCPIFSSKDFLQFASSIISPNTVDTLKQELRGVINLPLCVPSLETIALKFRQIWDMNLTSQRNLSLSLHARTVIESKDSKAARDFAKQICPQSERAKIWSIILGIQLQEKEKNVYYERIKSAVVNHDLFIDKLIMKDVQITAGNDDQYFIFEDVLLQTILCFFRDTEVLLHSSRSGSAPFLLNDPENKDRLLAYPPCGVIPFHGFSMYVAPLCYLYNNPVDLYYVFREMYLTYWSHLHIFTSNENGILALSLLFEKLLQMHEQELWNHLRTRNIQPLCVVFKWFLCGFSGYLLPKEVLQLWDLIMAFDSLLFLPVLAAAILSLRHNTLLCAEDLRMTEFHIMNSVKIQTLNGKSLILKARKRVYLITIASSMLCFAELTIGHVNHSLTLLVDAYHIMYNILTLAGSILAFEMNKRPISLKNTFGWTRCEVVGMLTSLTLLTSLCFGTLIESLQILFHSSHHDAMHNSGLIGICAAFSFLINSLCIFLIGGYSVHQHNFLFLPIDSPEEKISMPSDNSILHRLSLAVKLKCYTRDFTSCICAAAASLTVAFSSGWTSILVDPLLSIVSITVIQVLSFPYIRESALILLQTLPQHLTISKIEEFKIFLKDKFSSIKSIHHVHLWCLTPSFYIFTAHVVFQNEEEYLSCIHALKHCIAEYLGFCKITLQPEFFIHTDEKICILKCEGKQCKDLTCCNSKYFFV